MVFFFGVAFLVTFLTTFLGTAFFTAVFLTVSFFILIFLALGFLDLSFPVLDFLVISFFATGGLFLIVAFLIATLAFVGFTDLVGIFDFLTEGFVTLEFFSGLRDFWVLSNLTGPEGPFGWEKSPLSTPFLKAALNNASKLVALVSKLL